MNPLGIDTFKKVFGRDPFVRFKGGGGGSDPPSSTLSDNATRKYARQELYPMVNRGLKGKGFGTPQFQRQRKKSFMSDLNESFGTAKSELTSQMNRTLDPDDFRVKDYLSNTLSREYVTKKDDINRALRTEKVADTDMSMNLAADYLASEKRMTVSGAQMYNQAVQGNIAMQGQAGTFGTNVASGLGSGMADYYYAQKMGAS